MDGKLFATTLKKFQKKASILDKCTQFLGKLYSGIINKSVRYI